MRLSFEVPEFLNNNKFNEYFYYLDIFDDKDTLDFVESQLKSGRTVYLDNSLYERISRNIEFNPKNYKKLVDYLRHYVNMYFIVPDFYNSNELSLKYLDEYKHYINKIVVIHGDSISEYIDFYETISADLDKTSMIAFSAGDKFMDIETRTEIVEKLLETRKFNFKLKHHFLGLKHPKELDYISRIKDYIYSLDTSLPVSACIENKKIQDLEEKPKTLIYDIYYSLKSLDLDLLNSNIAYIRSKLC